ncbi:MAG: thioredoxin [Bacteroidota bacterium]
MYSTIAIIMLLLAFGIFIYRRYKMFAPALGSNQKDSEKLIILNDKNFNSSIKQGVTLVDFWAEWCQPCKLQGPIVSQLADDISSNGVKICKFDVEKNPMISKKLGIRNIPTIIIFKNGKKVEQLVGLKGKAALEKAVKKAHK